MKPRFSIGDVVSVQMNTQDADSGIWLDGWRGRIVSIDADIGRAGRLLYTVAWDSVTIDQMPDTYIRNAHARGIDWHSYMLTADDLLVSSARDSEMNVAGARAAVEDTVLAKRGMPPADFLPSFLYDDEFAPDFDGEFDDSEFDDDFDPEDAELPSLDEFFTMMEIPAREQKSLRVLFYKTIRHMYEEPPRVPMEERDDFIMIHLAEPMSFGALAAAACRSPNISDATRLKLAGNGLAMVEPLEPNGFPDSAEILLSEVARQGQLEMSLYALIVIGSVLSRDSWWLSRLQIDDARLLTEFLVTHEEDPERLLFWLSVFALQSQSVPQLGGRLADLWLTDERIPHPVRQSLCDAWLAHTHDCLGKPPVVWQLFDAVMRQDEVTARQLLQQIAERGASDLTGLVNMADEELVQAEETLQTFVDEFTNALDAAAEEGTSLSFGPYSMHRGIMTGYLLPSGFMRRAVSGAIVLGADPIDVLETNLGVTHQFYGEPLALGAADALKEFSDRLDPAEVRRLVDQGCAHSRVGVRKAFYRLGQALYGVEYIRPALDDSAASLRRWALKEIGKAEEQ